MSVLVSVVGSNTVAMAADSIQVEFQHGAVRPTLGYQKVLKDSARVAGFAGIGSLDSWQMNEALLTCLRTAPALDHVVPLLMANHEGPLRQATQLWGELFGRQDAAIVIHVAERTPRGIEAFEYFWVENRASGFRGFETAALAAERDNAYVTLHGAFDSEAARWSSQYRLDHMMAGIARTGSLPLAPHRVSPQMPTAEARELAEAIAQGVIDRGQAPAPPGWPQGIPVVGGAASSVAV